MGAATPASDRTHTCRARGSRTRLDVVVAEPLADVDVVAADVLRAHAAVVLLAAGVHKVAARQLLVHGEPAAGSGRWGFWLHLA